jgi:multiple antibiotic resistance protein
MLEEFITLWAVIDPVGTLPVFIAVTAGLAPAEQRRVAVKAAAVSAGILLGFIAVGQLVLEALDISLAAFQIAGGIVLFLFALTMIFGDSKPESDLAAPRGEDDVAVFPLAIPSIASPGAMLSVVLLTDNNRFDLAEQAATAGLTLAVLAAALGVMLAAGPLGRFLGNAGSMIVSRVMGLILASVAVDNLLEALGRVGALPPL